MKVNNTQRKWRLNLPEAVLLELRIGLVNYAHATYPDLDPEALVQEAFCRVAKVPRDLQSGKSILSYLKSSLKNLAIDEFRRRKRQAIALEALGDKVIDNPSTPVAGGLTIDEILEPLSHRERIVVLALASGSRKCQIAEFLGVSPRTVRNDQLNAQEKLRPLLE